VTVLPDDALGPADCRVEWASGGAERVAAQMWREFDAATQRIFSDPVGEGEEDPGHDMVQEPSEPAGEAISAAVEPDPAVEMADALPEALNGHANGHASAATDPICDLIAEPAAEPTDEPPELPTELPTLPDDAATGPGTASRAGEPPDPATAS
jgi:hypothetical protein